MRAQHPTDPLGPALIAGSAHVAADALVRAVRSSSDAHLRAACVSNMARAWGLEAFARVLDVLCQRAEQAEHAAREVLIAVVDALNAESMVELAQRLREQAAGESLLALERLLRHPISIRPEPLRPAAAVAHPGGVGKDRNGSTLGHRKALARRPDRDLMQRLLADPHPEVIHRCLANPRLTEDDVLRLAAKRPNPCDVLAEIARSRWVHRPPVRLALVLNPHTPGDVAARIAGLLLRPELARVAQSPCVPAGVRALCLEHLARRPPFRTQTAGALH